MTITDDQVWTAQAAYFTELRCWRSIQHLSGSTAVRDNLAKDIVFIDSTSMGTSEYEVEHFVGKEDAKAYIQFRAFRAALESLSAPAVPSRPDADNNEAPNE